MDITRLRLVVATALVAATALVTIAVPAAHATYPGKNGPILFHDQGNIWKIGADGSKFGRVTKVNDADVSTPSVSPDGRRVAVTVDPDAGTSEIWTADLKGKHAVWVTKALSKSGKFLSFENPAWTKDGKRLVFLCNSFSKHEFCSTTASGKGFKYLTHCECVNTGASDGPDISRSNKVVWARGTELFTVSASGGSPKTIATLKGTNDVNFQYPSWSPDGKQIAVQINDANTAVEILNADGSNRHRILQSPDFSTDRTDYGDPAWAPDGTRLAIQVAGLGPSQGGKPEGIYTVDTNGGDLQPVRIPQVGQEFDQYLELDWARKPK
jgi:Tol biopolymer transport system component